MTATMVLPFVGAATVQAIDVVPLLLHVVLDA
jgi:hypothetical protein